MAKNQKTAEKPRKRKAKVTRRNADKYDLYQRSVQEPAADVKFFRRILQKPFRGSGREWGGSAYACTSCGRA